MPALSASQSSATPGANAQCPTPWWTTCSASAQCSRHGQFAAQPGTERPHCQASAPVQTSTASRATLLGPPARPQSYVATMGQASFDQGPRLQCLREQSLCDPCIACPKEALAVKQVCQSSHVMVALSLPAPLGRPTCQLLTICSASVRLGSAACCCLRLRAVTVVAVAACGGCAGRPALWRCLLRAKAAARTTPPSSSRVGMAFSVNFCHSCGWGSSRRRLRSRGCGACEGWEGTGACPACRSMWC